MKIKRKTEILICLILYAAALCGCSGSKLGSTIDIVSQAVDDMQALSERPETAPTPAPELPPEATPTPISGLAPKYEPEAEPAPTPHPTPRSDVFLTGSQQADYLRLRPYSSVSSDERRELFVSAAMSGLAAAHSAEQDIAALCESVIYGESANIGFLLSVVDVCGLTDLGMYDVFPDCNMQYRYLLETNGFGSCALSDCIPFGGNIEAVPGDLVFWLDEAGKAVNYGFVTAVNDNWLRVVLCRENGSRASFDMNWANLGQSCISQGVLIHPIYPSVEQMVYYFCVDELGFTQAVACGIMANLQRESSYSFNVEQNGSYGLCQWTGERRGELNSFCNNNALDASSVYGQLCFMANELCTKEKYIPLYQYLISLGNTAEDAYNAAREFCYKYEAPGDIANAGRDRGLLARDTLWSIYSKYS